MILAHGIDAVDISRFRYWHKYSNIQLLHVFSLEEIDYCLQNQYKSAERFAARFAAKEAFYKAACSFGLKNISFLAFCKMVYVEKKEDNTPLIKINIYYTEISDMLHSMEITLSITHSKTLAIASIIIYK
ncbi:MAG: 4'-phosphopantetheinyl transferase superfamily protein [Candidatus Babeliales bacterium]|nr:4'-phosphopantetheinyl transferase superfamily protein [Candidatus Babeliales bacterium]